MEKEKQSKGICVFCGSAYSRIGMSKHLLKCQKINEISVKMDRTTHNKETIYFLRIEDAYNKDYWLYLEMAGLTRLEELDSYLRAIWLECCGHLSEFTTGGWRGSEIDMNSRASKVFEKGLELDHIYDFGTSSITKIKVITSRIGCMLSKHPITLLARNIAPDYKCTDCSNNANWLCMECLIENNVWGVFCDKHILKHPHDAYGEPVPLVNSPRIGMCGYTGPADPPY